MKFTLELMVNSRINVFMKRLDYWWVSLDIGEMAIYNPVLLHNRKGEEINLDENIPKIVGKKIRKVEIREDECISLKIGIRYYLLISLNPNDYTGPEALSILLKTGETIVE